MASRQTVAAGAKLGRPLLSVDYAEAKKHVHSLYKAWCRYIPYIVKYYDIPKNECQVKQRIREEFYKHACVTDYRVIDVLVLKGYMELKEVTETWQQKGHVMANWNPTAEPKPTTFIEKFLAGVD